MTFQENCPDVSIQECEAKIRLYLQGHSAVMAMRLAMLRRTAELGQELPGHAVCLCRYGGEELVALFEQGTWPTLLEAVDQALYQAKRDGKNRIYRVEGQ